MSGSVCPHCGADVPARALACPECGSDADTGWASDEDLNDAAYAPFDEEDYADVIRGLPGAEPEPVDTKRILLSVIGLITVIAFVIVFVLAG